MRLSLALAAFIAVGPAFANPTPPGNGMVIPLSRRAVQMQDGNGVVNGQALRSLAAKTRRKLGRGFPAYERNLDKAPPFAMRASTDVLERDDGSGVEPLTEDQNGLWHGTISVGTPPVNFTVTIDTTSSQLILPGPLCGTECQGREIYDTTASSTAKDLDEPFENDSTGGLAVKGEVFTDSVAMAGLTAINQTIGVASQLPIDILRTDGLMGMGLSEYSIFKTNTFLDNLFVQGAIHLPQFSLKLAGNDSQLFLGGSNSSLFIGEFTTLNVTQGGYQWQTDLDAVNVGSSQTVIGTQAVINTGSAFIAGPVFDIFEFYQTIPGSKDATETLGLGIFTIPCNTDPQVSFTLGGKIFPIPLSSLTLGKVTEGSTDCVGSIVALPGLPYWALGTPFLENYYTTFDSGAKQVGFATLA